MLTSVIARELLKWSVDVPVYVYERRLLGGREHILCLSEFLKSAQYLAYGRQALKSIVSPDSPMLRVTVMMLSDMVESVMLLKDED